MKKMTAIITATIALLILSITAIAQQEPEFPLIDATIASLRKGIQPSIAQLSKCENEKYVYYESLAEKYGTWTNTEYGSEDQYGLYILMIKMALIDTKEYGRWPFRSSLRKNLAEELKTHTETSEEPFLHFCAIIPSLSRDDVEHAIACFKFIQQHDPFLAKTASTWVNKDFPESDTKTAFMNATKEL